MQFLRLARIRANQSVFVFLLHPSPLSHIILFHNGLGVKEKPIFSFTSSFTLEMRERRLLQKNRIFFFLSRRKLQKGGGFRPKVFTQNQLIHNYLHETGEEVKAKNEKPLCAHYARARPPHLHSEHRDTSTSSRRALVVERLDRHFPTLHAPSDPFFHKNHRQTCPPPNNSYICSTHT